MKSRRSNKPRHRFKFTLKVDHVIFPKAIARKLSSSKFYVLLNRADKNHQTQIGYISKDGKLEFNEEEISIEATLFKNRNSNTYISKHCRIVLRQIKNANHQNTKARESSVGSIKFDLVDYIDRVATSERLLFSKCALEDVFIECCIRAQELEETDDTMSVTSANTIRVDSFWLDIDDQKSTSPTYNHNTEITNHYKRYNGYEQSEGHTDNEHEGGMHIDDQGSDSTVPIERKELMRLTDQHLVQFDGKQKEMAKFRIKHAMDIMANENNSFDDLYEMYEKEQKDLNRCRENMVRLEQEIKHFHEEEEKWNKAMIEWEREKTSFEASTIELNFKYQQQKQENKECKQELSEVTLSMKRIVAEKQRMEQKYSNLVQSLSKDRKPLLVQISALQMEYDDLEESLIQQQNSFRETGIIMEMELEKQKRKTLKAVNEMKKYKQRYERLKPENLELHNKIESLQKEIFKMKSKHEIEMAVIKYEVEQKLKASEHLVNELMMSAQRHNDDNSNKDNVLNEEGNEAEIEFYEAEDDTNDDNKSTDDTLKHEDKIEEESAKSLKNRKNKSISSVSSHSSTNVLQNIKRFNSDSVGENGNDMKPKKRRKSGRLKRKSVSGRIDEENNKKKRGRRKSSVQSMIEALEQDKNIMIEQELLSPLLLSANDDENDEDKVYNGNEDESKCEEHIIEMKSKSRMTDVSDLNNISEILIQEKEDMGGIDIDVDMDGEIENELENPGHRHVRSSNSVNIGTLETLSGININDLMINGNNERNLSDDDHNGENVNRRKPQHIVDID